MQVTTSKFNVDAPHDTEIKLSVCKSEDSEKVHITTVTCTEKGRNNINLYYNRRTDVTMVALANQLYCKPDCVLPQTHIIQGCMD
jgi:hypothetical protein